MKNNVYGYVRVSTKEQNEARQVIAMYEFGVDEQNVFVEKQSGKDFNRPKYKRLLRKLKAGDTLVIKSIDRLGRNYEEILQQFDLLRKEIEDVVVRVNNKEIKITVTIISQHKIHFFYRNQSCGRMHIKGTTVFNK